MNRLHAWTIAVRKLRFFVTSEFDDCVDPAARKRSRRPSRARSAVPELIADAYRRAAAPLRRKLLERLLRPVGLDVAGNSRMRHFVCR